MNQLKLVVVFVVLVCGFALEGNANNHPVQVKHKTCMVDAEELNGYAGETITWTLDAADSLTIKFVKGPTSRLHPCVEGQSIPFKGLEATCTIDTVHPGKYTYHIYDSSNHYCGDPTVVVQDGVYNGKPRLKKSGMKPTDNTGAEEKKH